MDHNWYCSFTDGGCVNCKLECCSNGDGKWQGRGILGIRNRKKSRKSNQEDEENGNEKIGYGKEEKELEDQYEFEIEHLVADFVDEEFIRMDMISESSNEEEDNFYAKDRRRKKADKLEVWVCFSSGFEFKEVVLLYALKK